MNITRSARCPKCGSPLVVKWSYVGGRGERLVARCSMTNAPLDSTQQPWCDFGVPLEGNEHLFEQPQAAILPLAIAVAQGVKA